MAEKSEFRGREESAIADPYQPPMVESRPVERIASGRLALRVVEWTLGLPLVLIGLAQCGMAALGLVLSFVADVPMTAGMAGALFGNGLMLAAPGALLCGGRSWAAWIVLAYVLFSVGVGLTGIFVALLVFGCILALFATTILILAARAGSHRPDPPH